MNYWQYTLRTSAETAEILLAYLSDSSFETFQEVDEGLYAWLPASADVEAADAQLETLRQDFPFDWSKEFIPATNWNEIWESNFQPVVVHDFCAVRAAFHDPIPGVEHELVIQPKMAFGTGHHETTWMCMAAMRDLPIAGGHLLDFGCGTGILAILAGKLGADRIEAVDIEEESWANTLENCQINGVDNITVRCGTLSAVEGSAFDGILANINRNVILESLPRLQALLKPGGWLLASGFMPADEALLTGKAGEAGFEVVDRWQRGNWLCIYFRRR